MRLDALRGEVDEINLQIIELLAKRLEITQRIASLKKDTAQPIADKAR